MKLLGAILKEMATEKNAIGSIREELLEEYGCRMASYPDLLLLQELGKAAKEGRFEMEAPKGTIPPPEYFLKEGIRTTEGKYGNQKYIYD